MVIREMYVEVKSVPEMTAGCNSDAGYGGRSASWGLHPIMQQHEGSASLTRYPVFTLCAVSAAGCIFALALLLGSFFWLAMLVFGATILGLCLLIAIWIGRSSSSPQPSDHPFNWHRKGIGH